MIKLVYSLDSARIAREAVQRLRQIGVSDSCISLAARPDIELERLPDALAAETTDFNDGLRRGVTFGGTTGLIAGLIAASIPSMGITLAGAVLVGVIGAAVGGWASALVGTTIPSELRREFESEIERGRVMLAVEVRDDDGGTVERAMRAMGDGVKPMLLHNAPVGA